MRRSSSTCTCGCAGRKRHTGLSIAGVVLVALLVPVAAFAAGPVFTSNSSGSTVHVTNTNASGTGVFAIATAVSGSNTGVTGRADAPNGKGVYGVVTATSGAARGVVGSSAAPNGFGVYGIGTGSGGNARGVYGRTTSPNGVGVYGHATGALACCLGTYGVFSDGNLGVSPTSRLICTRCVIARDMGLPVVRAESNASQSVPNSTLTALAFGGPDAFNTGITHSTSSQLEAVITGYYQVSGSIIWDANATGTRTLRVVKNGTTVMQEDSRVNNGGSTTTSQNISTLVSLTAGDYVELWGLQTSGGALGTAGSVAESFSMSFVSS